MSTSPHRRPIDALHVGTAGWSYRDWVGPFYPERTPAARYLGEYTSRFQAVEVDSTFYAIPAAKTVEGWARATPDEFRFAPKVPSIITHGAQGERPVVDRVLVDEDGALETFLEILAPIHAKLACVVFQFPYFRVKEMESGDFTDRLAHTLERLPTDIRFAVEIRNKTWIGEPFLDLLRHFHVAAVLIDHPYMPPPGEQLRLGMVTTDFSYIRLLGDRYKIEEKTTKWDRIVEDRSRRLRDWAEVIGVLVERWGVAAVYAFANNHYAGHAPTTARELWELVRNEPTAP